MDLRPYCSASCSKLITTWRFIRFHFAIAISTSERLGSSAVCTSIQHECDVYMMALRHILAVSGKMLWITAHDRCIGRRENIAWPARSSDLNRLDLYLWRHQRIVQSSPAESNEALHHRIVDACQTNGNISASLNWCASGWDFVEECIVSLRGHFELSLKTCFFSYNSANWKFLYICWCEHFVLFWFAELLPKMCPSFSFTPHVLHIWEGKIFEIMFNMITKIFLKWWKVIHTLKYNVFQKELYNFESLYKFIQRACAVFWTAIM
jgi:hypothetical protein